MPGCGDHGCALSRAGVQPARRCKVLFMPAYEAEQAQVICSPQSIAHPLRPALVARCSVGAGQGGGAAATVHTALCVAAASAITTGDMSGALWYGLWQWADERRGKRLVAWRGYHDLGWWLDQFGLHPAGCVDPHGG